MKTKCASELDGNQALEVYQSNLSIVSCSSGNFGPKLPELDSRVVEGHSNQLHIPPFVTSGQQTSKEKGVQT